MISLAHRYADFGPSVSGSFENPLAETSDAQDNRLESFEAGYRAGWDDSAAAQKEEQSHISAEFAQSLQDMSFGYVEATSKLSAALRVVMEQVIANLLPRAAQTTLAAHLSEQLSLLVWQEIDDKVEILAAPASSPAIQAVLEEQTDLAFTVRRDDQLSENQVLFRINQTEREINFDEIIDTMSQAMDAFFQQSEKELSNGTL